FRNIVCYGGRPVVSLSLFYCFFFFQAEDGIRDFHVTGVQTCALPISAVGVAPSSTAWTSATPTAAPTSCAVRAPIPCASWWNTQIGRASCRERVKISVVAVA